MKTSRAKTSRAKTGRAKTTPKPAAIKVDCKGTCTACAVPSRQVVLRQPVSRQVASRQASRQAPRKASAPDARIFRRQAQVLKALANESRLMIVERLSRGECSVGELTRLVGSDQSTVSKHLAVLRAHGIVGDHRRGSIVNYELLTPCVISFFSCAMKVIEERE